MAPLHLTSAGKIIKTPTVSISTASVAPQGSGMLLLWVMTLVGHTNAPIPSANGLGLTWSQVANETKHDDDVAPRRLTLLKANFAAPPTPGPIILKLSEDSASWTGTWIWSLVQTSATSVVQTGTNGLGTWVKSYDVNLPNPPAANHDCIVGWGIGYRGTINATPPSTKLGQGSASIASCMSAWGAGLQHQACNWDTLAHSIAIAVEVA